MLKVVVYDGGFGGELFADLLEQEIPVLKVIRVIDWRHAEALNSKAKAARAAAETALAPYLGKVDLIIFANHLLSMTSLRYFRRKYSSQKFLGVRLELPEKKHKRECLVLTTKAVSRTLNYWSYVFRLHMRARTLRLDTWPSLIDDGELAPEEIASTLELEAISRQQPRNIILGCTTFRDIEHELRNYFHGQAKVYDGFDAALSATCKMLKIRGGLGKKRR